MYPQEYIDYLVHFHGDRDYFECHEVLEEYWKKVDNKNKESILVGFILLAVSNYHHRRNNFTGAKRTLKKALAIFIKQSDELTSFGFTPNVFINFIKGRLDYVENHKKYKSINLPLEDSSLIRICEQLCSTKGLIWCDESNLSDDQLIHKHIKRDRSEVMLERKIAINARKNKGRE
ncbi:DUF309 domain-containing protein [Bacillus dakarensis]|uniref:DUF309 domain-containing protein n=1 Tax=Robertmurraya dakarensis TaxID=1926278 RepID=UPI0009825142|nr:DUF309 domain-containing protein [Bacillus dakarensis]